MTITEPVSALNLTVVCALLGQKIYVVVLLFPSISPVMFVVCIKDEEDYTDHVKTEHHRRRHAQQKKDR